MNDRFKTIGSVFIILCCLLTFIGMIGHAVYDGIPKHEDSPYYSEGYEEGYDIGYEEGYQDALKEHGIEQ